MTPTRVHALVGQDQGLVSTGCGVERKRRPGDPMPEDMTGWGSEVTCPDCLTRRRR